MPPYQRLLVAVGLIAMAISLGRRTDTPATAASAWQLDPIFGTAGIVRTDIQNRYDTATAVGLQPGGKIVLGYSSTALLLRYGPDGKPDSSIFLPLVQR